jgi:hypothetical protein
VPAQAKESRRYLPVVSAAALDVPPEQPVRPASPAAGHAQQSHSPCVVPRLRQSLERVRARREVLTLMPSHPAYQ